MLDEGIDQADLVISLTSSDSNNIMSSLLAKYHGARRCITKITRHDFVPLLGQLGIDIALSSRQVAASMILRFVRRGAVGTVATIMNSDAEAMEIKVPMNRNFDNVALKDLNFRQERSSAPSSGGGRSSSPPATPGFRRKTTWSCSSPAMR